MKKIKIDHAKEILKFFPEYEIEDKKLFNFIAETIINYKPENDYNFCLGHAIGVFEELLEMLKKTGWKKS